MPSSRPVPASSSWLPDLANPGAVYALLALGLAGMLTELLSTMFARRLVLYLLVFSFGVARLVRHRRADRRRQAASRVMTSLAGGGQVTTAVRRRNRPRSPCPGPRET